MRKSPWARSFERSLLAISRQAVKAGTRSARQALGAVVAKRTPPPGFATLVEIDQLAHAWSGGAARQAHGDGRGPDASRMVWAFAARQFRT